jgi:hypothetical protein
VALAEVRMRLAGPRDGSCPAETPSTRCG